MKTHIELQNQVEIRICQGYLDYATVGDDQDGSDANMLLIGRDRHSKFTFCHLVSEQGVAEHS